MKLLTLNFRRTHQYLINSDDISFFVEIRVPMVKNTGDVELAVTDEGTTLFMKGSDQGIRVDQTLQEIDAQIRAWKSY